MTEKIIKTFKDVHVDLENEFLFINKEYDIQRFKEKVDFIKIICFDEANDELIFKQTLN